MGRVLPSLFGTAIPRSLAKDLMRPRLEAQKLRCLIIEGDVDDTHLAKFDPTIGSGLIPEQEPGVVELF